MFTSIRHPKTGIEIQIKSGDDMCEWYNVGDKVNRGINKNWWESGRLFDGCYDGFSYEDNVGKHYIVIIQKQRIKEVIDVGVATDEGFYDIYNVIRKKFPTKIPYSYYTKKAKYRHIQWHIEWQREYAAQKIIDEKYRDKLIAEYGVKEGTHKYICYLFTKVLRRKIDWVDMARKFVTVEPWPKGKPLTFDHNLN